MNDEPVNTERLRQDVLTALAAQITSASIPDLCCILAAIREEGHQADALHRAAEMILKDSIREMNRQRERLAATPPRRWFRWRA